MAFLKNNSDQMYKFTQSCPFHFVDEEMKAQQDSKRLWTHNSSVSHLPQSLRGLPSSAVLLVGNLFFKGNCFGLYVSNIWQLGELREVYMKSQIVRLGE